ncbi:MAG: hypothetical protein DMF64_11400 [Acidobacteria bacterium]|nr:MAG: hypothetical protein DMF64_11400 [Acidobacteriota bacterium]
MAHLNVRGVYTLRIVICGTLKGHSLMTGTQIRDLRKALGYTQARLAEEISVTANTVARYERNELRPSPPVMKLLKLLNMLLTEKKAA